MASEEYMCQLLLLLNTVVWAGGERALAFYSLVLSPAPPLLVSVTPPIQVFDRLLAVNASQYHSSIHLTCTRMLTFNLHFLIKQIQRRYILTTFCFMNRNIGHFHYTLKM